MPLVNGNLAVYSFGALDLLGIAENLTLDLEVKTQQGKGIGDLNSEVVTVGHGGKFATVVQCEGATVPLMGVALSTNPAVSCVLTTGGSGATDYAFDAGIERARHSLRRDDIQKVDVSLVTLGEVTVDVVSP